MTHPLCFGVLIACKRTYFQVLDKTHLCESLLRRRPRYDPSITVNGVSTTSKVIWRSSLTSMRVDLVTRSIVG